MNHFSLCEELELSVWLRKEGKSFIYASDVETLLKNAIKVVGFKFPEDGETGWAMSQGPSEGMPDTHSGLLLNLQPLDKSVSYAPVSKAEIKALTEETKVKWEDIQKRIEAGGICD